MKNRYYTCATYSGSLASGGFDSLEDAKDYSRRHNRGNNTVFTDCRESPHPEALDILQRVWGAGHTLTPDEYASLVRLAGMQDKPCGEHPSALYLALALAGQLSRWEDAGKPRDNQWFIFLT